MDAINFQILYLVVLENHFLIFQAMTMSTYVCAITISLLSFFILIKNLNK